MSYGEVNLPAGFAVMAAWFAFLVLMLAARRGASGGGEQPKRDLRSLFGILVQGAGVASAWYGATHYAGRAPSPAAWVAAVPIMLMAAAGAGLFGWSTVTMGANWSLVARTRGDHQLVQTGPFALMRHPIYVALFLMTVATALAAGHAPNLLLGIPLYAIGTLWRVDVEERLLKEKFAGAYLDYAKRVKRFGLF